jgi:hypothetical protein
MLNKSSPFFGDTQIHSRMRPGGGFIIDEGQMPTAPTAKFTNYDSDKNDLAQCRKRTAMP